MDVHGGCDDVTLARRREVREEAQGAVHGAGHLCAESAGEAEARELECAGRRHVLTCAREDKANLEATNK